jgi:hypothetical protein
VVDALVTTAASGQEDSEWAQAFAAIVNDVMGYLVDERNVAAESPKDDAVDTRPVVPDQGAQAVERRAGMARLDQRHENNDASRVLSLPQGVDPSEPRH